MSELPTITLNGREILALPPSTSARPSSLVFGMHKGGSSLLNRLVRWLCRIADQPYVPVMAAFEDAGIAAADAPPETGSVFRPTGYCYGSFRQFPTSFEIPILGQVPALLLVRDPRDMLTSLYFAARRVKGGSADRQLLIDRAAAQDIDAFVLANADKYVADFDVYARHLSGALELRYEDVVYDKLALVARVVGHLGFAVSEARFANIAAKLDEVPDTDRPDQHVRQVHPGDHARKLKPETVAALNAQLAPVLERYGYR